MLGFHAGDIEALACEHSHVMALQHDIIRAQVTPRLLVDVVISPVRDDLFVLYAIRPRTVQLILALGYWCLELLLVLLLLMLVLVIGGT